MLVVSCDYLKTNNFYIGFPPNNLYNKEKINLLLAWL